MRSLPRTLAFLLMVAVVGGGALGAFARDDGSEPAVTADEAGIEADQADEFTRIIFTNTTPERTFQRLTEKIEAFRAAAAKADSSDERLDQLNMAEYLTKVVDLLCRQEAPVGCPGHTR